MEDLEWAYNHSKIASSGRKHAYIIVEDCKDKPSKLMNKIKAKTSKIRGLFKGKPLPCPEPANQLSYESKMFDLYAKNQQKKSTSDLENQSALSSFTNMITNQILEKEGFKDQPELISKLIELTKSDILNIISLRTLQLKKEYPTSNELLSPKSRKIHLKVKQGAKNYATCDGTYIEHGVLNQKHFYVNQEKYRWLGWNGSSWVITGNQHLEEFVLTQKKNYGGFHFGSIKDELQS